MLMSPIAGVRRPWGSLGMPLPTSPEILGKFDWGAISSDGEGRRWCFTTRSSGCLRGLFLKKTQLVAQPREVSGPICRLVLPEEECGGKPGTPHWPSPPPARTGWMREAGCPPTSATVRGDGEACPTHIAARKGPHPHSDGTWSRGPEAGAVRGTFSGSQRTAAPGAPRSSPGRAAVPSAQHPGSRPRYRTACLGRAARGTDLLL